MVGAFISLLSISFKIWIGGVLLIVGLVILGNISHIIYDWRWYFKGELPPRSILRKVKRLESEVGFRGPFEMYQVYIDKDEAGVPTGEVTLGFRGQCGGRASISCHILKRHLRSVYIEFWNSLIFILVWPICVAENLADRVRRF